MAMRGSLGRRSNLENWIRALSRLERLLQPPKRPGDAQIAYHDDGQAEQQPVHIVVQADVVGKES
jgi:hypothetical protein